MKKIERNSGLKIRLPVYAGICFDEKGFYVSIKSNGKNWKAVFVRANGNLERKVYSWLYKYAVDNYVKIIGAGFSSNHVSEKLLSDLWLKEDIIPFVFNIKNGNSNDKADSAAESASKKFGNDNIVGVELKVKRQVEELWLASLDDFRKTDEKGFEALLELSEKFKKQKGVMIFFSSTPRGGGVALMRHSLIRLYRLLGLDVHWYVMSSKHKVFQITKKKFHNILQAVAPPDLRLSDHDKEVLKLWIEKNANRFKEIFKKAKVIVIDDPQPSGMIPYIKKINPNVKIIYRSHIQLESALINKRGTPQNEIWNFLWNSIKYMDVFVSHPVVSFIPDNVPKNKTVLMTASTDKLDGLNKDLPEIMVDYYLDLFNQELKSSPLDPRRPYIVQIARFDPSKGIPDVIESYKMFRELLKKSGYKKKRTPQLVIAGHGAADDPEGRPIFKEIMDLINSDRFKEIAGDIKVARLPANDQILNALMRKCLVALQLSHKEGFEVKVSEALDKGKPVIAYRSGGIPLQIEDGITGYLVKVGDTGKVAQHLFELINDKELYEKMRKNARERVNRDYFTVGNASKWLFLACELMEKGMLAGNRRYVREIMRQ